VPKRKLIIAGITGVVAAGSIGFGAAAIAAPADAASTIMKACVDNSDGSMRLVSSSAYKCKSGERLVKWNVQGAAGVKGAAGKDGKNGVNGKDGVNGKAGVDGIQGPAGKDGADRIIAAVGAPDEDVTAAAKEGDIYVDLTEGAVTLSVFTNGDWADSVPLQGAQGKQGIQGVPGTDGTKIYTGADATDEAVVGKANPGDFYFSTEDFSLSVFDGTEFADPVVLKGEKGAQGIQGIQGKEGQQGGTGPQGPAGPTGPTGPKGADGKSITIESHGPTGLVDLEDFTLTMACGVGETAVGAGFSDLPVGVQLVGSTVGATANKWELTFSADPTGVSGTVLCAVTSATA
jgi:Collagen triple helix repeat (20 copies)